MKYIIDFEGFALSSIFVIKEFVLSSLDSNAKTHFLLSSPNLNTRFLRFKDKAKISYCENWLHGIRWETRGKRFTDLRKFINLTLVSSDIIFIKGEEKVKIFCKQLNPPCRVRDINDLLTYAEVSKDWMSLAREQINSSGNNCPLYFHKSIPHCSTLKAEIFSKMLKTLPAFTKDYQNE